MCCISFDSYIKPQLCLYLLAVAVCCISFDSYIKPQPSSLLRAKENVVYLLIPTSNHNLLSALIYIALVVYLLIPTSNHNENVMNRVIDKLYIF